MRRLERNFAVLMLSWEFPPRVVGGISPHVYNLSRALSRKGIDVHVATCDFPGAPDYEEIEGVHVYRIDSYKAPSPDFASWIYLMNTNLQRGAIDIIKKIETPVILHAHDWLVATASIGLKQTFRIPLVATFHSTEMGRRDGIYTDYQRMIHQTEWWLAFEAWGVLCCSNYMASCVIREFGLPRDKVHCIKNGVDVNEFDIKFDRAEFRKKFALPEEKIILYVGRLVYEKGPHVLLDAFPAVLSQVNAKLVVVGEGYMKERLLHQANQMGIGHKVYVTGFLDDMTLKRLYLCADVCVFPSFYEPFGITALEAMAAKVPVVVSDVGGLSEIVEHDRTGVKVPANDSSSLAGAIIRVLLDEGYAQWIRSNAYDKVLSEYSWDSIASSVNDFYLRVLEAYERSPWKPT